MKISGAIKDGKIPRIAIILDDFPGFVPVVEANVGQEVAAGSPLMHHRNYPSMCIVSPICGKVREIKRDCDGRLRHLVVRANTKAEAVEFDCSQPFMELLARSGFLSMMRRKGSNDMATPLDRPCRVVVSDAFAIGDDAGEARRAAAEAFDALVAESTGANEKCTWVLDGNTYINIGRLLLTGQVDGSAIVSVCGDEVSAPTLVRTAFGCDIKPVIAGLLKDSRYRIRILSNGIDVNEADGFLRYPYTHVEVIPYASEEAPQPFWSRLIKHLNFFSKLRALSYRNLR